MVATACPSMYKVLKSSLSTYTKLRDKQLAKQQAFLLDAVGPITHILEEAAKGQESQKTTIDTAQTALELMSLAMDLSRPAGKGGGMPF